MTEPCTIHARGEDGLCIRCGIPMEPSIVTTGSVTFTGTLTIPEPLPDIHREAVVICRGSTLGYYWNGTIIIHAASETCVICREDKNHD